MLCARELKPKSRLSTGDTGLDRTLGGGIPCFPITEIVGEAGVGKTQFVLRLALTAQREVGKGGLGGGCVLISTEGRLPISRLCDFLKLEEDLDQVALDSILVDESILSAQQLWFTLRDRLPSILSSGRFKLVVIDSITSVFRGEFQDLNNNSSLDRNDWLFGISSMMKNLSSQFGCVFVVSNQVSWDPLEGKLKEALGLAWSHCINQRLSLAFKPSSENTRLRQLSVTFSPELSSCLQCTCSMGQTGLHAVI